VHLILKLKYTGIYEKFSNEKLIYCEKNRHRHIFLIYKEIPRSCFLQCKKLIGVRYKESKKPFPVKMGAIGSPGATQQELGLKTTPAVTFVTKI